MSTLNKRPFSNYIPGYSKNAVLQLIVYSGTAFVIFHFIRIILLLTGYDPMVFVNSVEANVALQHLDIFKSKFWTLFTYGWFHLGFWNLVSNMIWLYCFGNLVQMLVGYKQVIPLFVYSLVSGGLFFLLSQFIPGRAFEINGFLLGPQAGLMGFAVAAITLTPRYRFFLTQTFSVPLLLVAAIFVGLMALGTQGELPLLFLLAGGGLTGFVYIRLLRNGYKPGEWAYNLYGRLERTVTPDEQAKSKGRRPILNRIYESKHDVTQKRIDEILDKINHKGYKSLTQEEKDILMRAGKEI